MKDAAVNRLAKSITQLTLCQVTTSEVDAATKLLDKACQKLQGIQFFFRPTPSWLSPGRSTCFIACCKLGLID